MALSSIGLTNVNAEAHIVSPADKDMQRSASYIESRLANPEMKEVYRRMRATTTQPQMTALLATLSAFNLDPSEEQFMRALGASAVYV